MSIDELTVNAIRFLSVEAIEKANSGHPGSAMGAAPAVYTLWAKQMKHNPCNPNWENRDRFILSSGHISALLYSMLHIFGYDVTLDDLKNYRKLGSRTPGHPEYGITPGVEISTGPLGQGVANGVGMAIAEAYLAKKFNKPDINLVDHYTYVLAGDGCMMEGISGEAASIAGTLGLNKLIVLYDSNNISIEGNTNITFRENVGKRFEAYCWQVLNVADGNDLEAINKAIEKAKMEKDKPSIIIIKSIIGYGAPKAGTAAVHGSPLGEKDIKSAKKKLNWPYEKTFYVPDEVKEHMGNIKKNFISEYDKWISLKKLYTSKYPELAKEYDKWMNGNIPNYEFNDNKLVEFSEALATRKNSFKMINKYVKNIKNILGGSADLAPSTLTYMDGEGDFSKENRDGRNLHFGVREHAMAAIANGITIHGGLRIFVSTYLVFSDYMKAAMRMSALMKLPVIYILTHDSIGVGEDGPTHEPVEQLLGLRGIPNLTVIRPADGIETAYTWKYALEKKDAPTAIVLTRQSVPSYKITGKDCLKGAYVLKETSENPEILLMASGSEVELIYEAQKELLNIGVNSRIVSVPSFEIFEEQSEEYKEKVMPRSIRKRVAVEASNSLAWYKYVGIYGKVIGMDRFGASGAGKDLFRKFGFTVENVVEISKKLLEK